MSIKERVFSFIRERKKLILGLLVLYIILMILLVVISSGPQMKPFVYQVF